MFESDCYAEDVNSFDRVNGIYRTWKEVPIMLWSEYFREIEKGRNPSLRSIFQNEFNLMKRMYCFLDESQIMGRTLTKLGIPNICGKINKNFLRQPTKKSKLGNINKSNSKYFNKQILQHKTFSLKQPIPKQKPVKIKPPRYTPVVERWSDIALKRKHIDNNADLPFSEFYTFRSEDKESELTKDQKEVSDKAPFNDVKNSQPVKQRSDLKSIVLDENNFEYTKISNISQQSSVKNILNNDAEKATKLNDLLPITLSNKSINLKLDKCLQNRDVKGNSNKKTVRFNDNVLCTFAPSGVYNESSQTQEISQLGEIDKCISNIATNNINSSDNSITKKNVSQKTNKATSEKTHITKTMSDDDVSNQQLFKNIGKDSNFEIEPYEDNVVIEESSNSSASDSLKAYSIEENQMDTNNVSDPKRKCETEFLHKKSATNDNQILILEPKEWHVQDKSVNILNKDITIIEETPSGQDELSEGIEEIETCGIKSLNQNLVFNKLSIPIHKQTHRLSPLKNNKDLTKINDNDWSDDDVSNKQSPPTNKKTHCVSPLKNNKDLTKINDNDWSDDDVSNKQSPSTNKKTHCVSPLKNNKDLTKINDNDWSDDDVSNKQSPPTNKKTHCVSPLKNNKDLTKINDNDWSDDDVSNKQSPPTNKKTHCVSPINYNKDLTQINHTDKAIHCLSPFKNNNLTEINDSELSDDEYAPCSMSSSPEQGKKHFLGSKYLADITNQPCTEKVVYTTFKDNNNDNYICASESDREYISDSSDNEITQAMAHSGTNNNTVCESHDEVDINKHAGELKTPSQEEYLHEFNTDNKCKNAPVKVIKELIRSNSINTGDLKMTDSSITDTTHDDQTKKNIKIRKALFPNQDKIKCYVQENDAGHYFTTTNDLKVLKTPIIAVKKNNTEKVELNLNQENKISLTNASCTASKEDFNMNGTIIIETIDLDCSQSDCCERDTNDNKEVDISTAYLLSKNNLFRGDEALNSYISSENVVQVNESICINKKQGSNEAYSVSNTSLSDYKVNELKYHSVNNGNYGTDSHDNSYTPLSIEPLQSKYNPIEKTVEDHTINIHESIQVDEVHCHNVAEINERNDASNKGYGADLHLNSLTPVSLNNTQSSINEMNILNNKNNNLIHVDKRVIADLIIESNLDKKDAKLNNNMLFTNVVQVKEPIQINKVHFHNGDNILSSGKVNESNNISSNDVCYNDSYTPISLEPKNYFKEEILTNLTNNTDKIHAQVDYDMLTKQHEIAKDKTTLDRQGDGSIIMENDSQPSCINKSSMYNISTENKDSCNHVVTINSLKICNNIKNQFKNEVSPDILNNFLEEDSVTEFDLNCSKDEITSQTLKINMYKIKSGNVEQKPTFFTNFEQFPIMIENNQSQNKPKSQYAEIRKTDNTIDCNVFRVTNDNLNTTERKNNCTRRTIYNEQLATENSKIPHSNPINNQTKASKPRFENSNSVSQRYHLQTQNKISPVIRKQLETSPIKITNCYSLSKLNQKTKLEFNPKSPTNENTKTKRNIFLCSDTHFTVKSQNKTSDIENGKTKQRNTGLRQGTRTDSDSELKTQRLILNPNGVNKSGLTTSIAQTGTIPVHKKRNIISKGRAQHLNKNYFTTIKAFPVVGEKESNKPRIEDKENIKILSYVTTTPISKKIKTDRINLKDNSNNIYLNHKTENNETQSEIKTKNSKKSCLTNDHNSRVFSTNSVNTKITGYENLKEIPFDIISDDNYSLSSFSLSGDSIDPKSYMSPSPMFENINYGDLPEQPKHNIKRKMDVDELDNISDFESSKKLMKKQGLFDKSINILTNHKGSYSDYLELEPNMTTHGNMSVNNNKDEKKMTVDNIYSDNTSSFRTVTPTSQMSDEYNVLNSPSSDKERPVFSNNYLTEMFDEYNSSGSWSSTGVSISEDH